MKILKLFIKKIKWLLLANIYSSISKFILLVLIAQFSGPKEVGIYSLGLAVTAPITLLFNMKMKSIIVTEKNLNIRMFSNIRIISNLFAFLFIMLITYNLFKDYFIYFVFIGIIKILDLNSEFYQSLHNRNKNFHTTSKLIISKYSLVTIIFGATIWWSSSLELGLIFYIIVQTLHLIIERYYFRRYQLKELIGEKYSYKVLISFMLPLGITQMLYSFGSSIPKYLLEFYGTIEQVGIFSALLYFVTITNLFVNSILQSLLPYIREIYFESEKKFHEYIYIKIPVITMCLGAVLLIIVASIAEPILNFLYGEPYANESNLLYILTIAIIFSVLAWVYDTALLISRRTKLQPLLTLCNILITSLIGIILIKGNLLWGAVWTITFYQMCNFLLKYVYYKFSLKAK